MAKTGAITLFFRMIAEKTGWNDLTRQVHGALNNMGEMSKAAKAVSMAFGQMGGFPADFYPGEEMIAAYRTEKLGWGLRFLPGARVWHYPRSSPGRFWKQMWGYGATRIRLLRAGVSFHAAPLVPGLWVAATLGLAVASAWSRAARWLLAGELAAYALVALAVAAWTVRRTRRACDWALAAVVPMMHVAYGLAEWSELLRPGRDFTEPVRGSGR